MLRIFGLTLLLILNFSYPALQQFSLSELLEFEKQSLENPLLSPINCMVSGKVSPPHPAKKENRKVSKLEIFNETFPFIKIIWQYVEHKSEKTKSGSWKMENAWKWENTFSPSRTNTNVLIRDRICLQWKIEISRFSDKEENRLKIWFSVNGNFPKQNFPKQQDFQKILLGISCENFDVENRASLSLKFNEFWWLFKTPFQPLEGCWRHRQIQIINDDFFPSLSFSTWTGSKITQQIRSRGEAKRKENFSSHVNLPITSRFTKIFLPPDKWFSNHPHLFDLNWKFLLIYLGTKFFSLVTAKIYSPTDSFFPACSKHIFDVFFSAKNEAGGS